MPTLEGFTHIATGTVTAGAPTAPAAGTSQSLTVTAATAFPSASASSVPVQVFHFIDTNAPSELFLATAAPGGTGAGQSWTVTRGAAGTTPVAHTAPFPVKQVVSADWLAGVAAVQQVTQQLTVPGLHADGTTDDGPAIQAVLSALGTSGVHSYEVLAEAPPAGTIYINSTVQIQSSATTLRFGSPLVFGPNGRVRIYGSYSYTTPASPPVLTAAAAAGATSVTVSNGSYFPAGSYIEIRGDHDSSGAALWEDYALVTASAAGSGTTATLTLDSPLANSYSVTYTDGAQSQVAAVAATLCTATPNRGDRTVTVASTAAFSAGQYVQVLDDSLNVSSAGASQAQNFYNREISQVISVVSSTQLLLAHALHHTFSLSNNARVCVLNAVSQSHIKGPQVTWSAMSAVENAFEIRFGVASSIRDGTCTGGTYSWLNQAFRQSDSYFCWVDNCYAQFPVLTAAGQGYGCTFYGATYCTIRNSKATACRHSFLFYYGASGNEIGGCKSVDACISDYDLHGAACNDNHIADSFAVGGDSVPTDSANPQKAACKAGNENHIVGDFYNTFDNITVVNYTFGGQAAAMQVVAQSAGTTFRNFRVKNASYGLWLTDNSSAPTLVTSDTTVEGSRFEDCANLTNINGGTSAAIAGVTMIRNMFVRAVTALKILNASAAQVLQNTWIAPAQGTGNFAVNAQGVTGLAVKNNEMSGSQAGPYLLNCPAARITGNTMHDLVTTTVYQDAGGNNGTLFRGNDIFGYTPAVVGSGTSTGLVSLGLPYSDDSPAAHGYAEWNANPKTISSTSRQPVAGVLYLMKLIAQGSEAVSSVILDLGQLGAGATALANCYIGEYSPAGVLLAYSTDQSSAWSTGSTGVRAVTLNTAVQRTGGQPSLMALLIGTQSTTPLQLGGYAVTGPANANLTNANLVFGQQQAGLAALPSTITPSSSTAATFGLWFAED